MDFSGGQLVIRKVVSQDRRKVFTEKPVSGYLGEAKSAETNAQLGFPLSFSLFEPNCQFKLVSLTRNFSFDLKTKFNLLMLTVNLTLIRLSCYLCKKFNSLSDTGTWQAIFSALKLRRNPLISLKSSDFKFCLFFNLIKEAYIGRLFGSIADPPQLAHSNELNLNLV